MGMKHQRSSKCRRDTRVAGGALLVVLLLLGVGVAGAQQSPSEDAVVGVESPPGADLEPSPAQMVAQSKEAQQRMDRGTEHIRRQLGVAQEARDVVKSLCLDDKLSQMDVARASASDRVSGLESAVQSSDGERSRHEYAVIMALLERAQALLAEADQCIGEEAGALGDARLVVTFDPNIANTDPVIPTDALLSVPPVLTSPTR